MSIMKGGITGALSGRIGNVVAVTRGNTTYLRSMPTRKKNSWTPNQIQSRKRFAIVVKFCMRYKKNVIVPIWNLLPGNACGYSLFFGANGKAFDSEGNLIELSMLTFSKGNLPPAHQVKSVKKEGNLEVSWVNDPNVARTRLNDELWYMAVVGGQVVGPHNSGLTRGMQGGVFALKDPATSAIYVYFAASDKKSFSPDKYLEL